MVIGITINNTLRSHLPKLEMVYTAMTGQEPVYPINPYDLERSFTPTGTTESTDLIEFRPETKEDLEKEIEFTEYNDGETDFDVFNLLYVDASFEIFGSADETNPGIINVLSVLSNNSDEHEIILTNLESRHSKCATLFFLSKNAFNMKEIYFPSSREDMWEKFDLLVTDDPKLLNMKPEGKKTIKVENIFNSSVDSDYTVPNIKVLVDDFDTIIKTVQNGTNTETI